MKTFHDYFKPVYYSGRIIGIFHYNHRQAKMSFLSHCCSLPLIALHFYTFAESEKQPMSILCLIKFILDLIWFVYKKKQIRAVLDLINVMGNKLNFDYTKRSLTFEVIVFYASVLTFRVVNSVINYVLLDRSMTDGSPSCWNEITVIAAITLSTRIVTKMLRDFFAELNGRLEQMRQRNRNDALIEINKCAKLHLQLVGISRKLNTAFSFSLLSNALAFLMLITVYSYNIVGQMETSRSAYMERDFMLVIFVTFSGEGFLMWNLISMADSWHQLAKEANTTGLRVHDIWNKLENVERISTAVEKNKQQREIDAVSLQLLQNKLKFTLCKFVDLDRTLIYLVMQTVTLYLVWMLQIQS